MRTQFDGTNNIEKYGNNNEEQRNYVQLRHLLCHIYVTLSCQIFLDNSSGTLQHCTIAPYCKQIFYFPPDAGEAGNQKISAEARCS